MKSLIAFIFFFSLNANAITGDVYWATNIAGTVTQGSLLGNGSWLVSNVLAGGTTTLVFTNGVFTVPPVCICTSSGIIPGGSGHRLGNCVLGAVAPTTTGYTFNADFNGTTNSGVNGNTVECVGN